MNKLEKTIKDIKEVKIQGASRIARESLRVWGEILKEYNAKSSADFVKKSEAVAKKLGNARPNEPMTINLLQILNTEIGNEVKKGKGLGEIKKELKKEIKKMSELLHKNGMAIAQHGEDLIKNNDNIFTHCHSRTVENILVKAKRENKKFSVYHDETRPLMQGRITAKKLLKEKIKTTMVVDSAAPFVVSRISGDDIDIDKVIIGADVILPDGTAFNKIGSFGISLAAHTSKIPIYIATSILKFTYEKSIQIEIREEKEIWKNKPKKLKIINYSFGKIPASFITGYITEFGVLKPSEIKNIFDQNYK